MNLNKRTFGSVAVALLAPFVLTACGGVSEDSIAREFCKVIERERKDVENGNAGKEPRPRNEAELEAIYIKMQDADLDEKAVGDAVDDRCGDAVEIVNKHYDYHGE